MFSSIYHSIAYLSKGGIVMLPIIFCSVLALAVFIERLLTLKREKVIPLNFFEAVRESILENRLDEAYELCETNGSSLARIVRAGLENHDKPKAVVKEALEEAGRREAARLDKYTGIVGTIANITPLLGLLGTVSGMIKAFDVISSLGVGDPAVLAGGISEALITTASGLTVAIPSFVAYKFILSITDAYIMEMEEHSVHIVELLKGEKKGQLKKLSLRQGNK